MSSNRILELAGVSPLKEELLLESKKRRESVNRIIGEVMAGLTKAGADLSDAQKIHIRAGLEDAYDDGGADCDC